MNTLMNLGERLKNPIKLLLGLVLFDTVATFVFWSNNLMVEENPIMLWALQKGWVYWAFKTGQVGLVLVLGYLYTSNRKARFATWLLVSVFTFAWVQFFVGSII